ncbi:Uncharacterized protein conserved in archaea (DUF531) [Methanosarcina sp. WWM596]|nr:Uncharacterized protein conserved in archaea (DUF531) [Methanosarcina sp. WWM596]
MTLISPELKTQGFYASSYKLFHKRVRSLPEKRVLMFSLKDLDSIED